MCFLDASKAFGKVKHFVLFSKIVRRDVPGYVRYQYILASYGRFFSVQIMHKLNVAYYNAFRFMHHLHIYTAVQV